MERHAQGSTRDQGQSQEQNWDPGILLFYARPSDYQVSLLIAYLHCLSYDRICILVDWVWIHKDNKTERDSGSFCSQQNSSQRQKCDKDIGSLLIVLVSGRQQAADKLWLDLGMNKAMIGIGWMTQHRGQHLILDGVMESGAIWIILDDCLLLDMGKLFI